MNLRPFFTKSLAVRILSFTLGFLIVTISLVSFLYLNRKTDWLNDQIQKVGGSYQEIQTQYEEALFSDHLRHLEKIALDETKAKIETEYSKLKGEYQDLASEENSQKLAEIEEVYALYKTALEKIDRNQGVSIETQSASQKVSDWGVKFLNQEFDALKTEIAQTNESLDQDHEAYLASIAPPPPPPTPAPTPTPAPAPAPATEGYSYQTVSIGRGNFGVYLIKLPLASVTVKTVTANQDDCDNNCPTKNLAQYVTENGGYAGIHGSYFCPPDYASCAGKINSYDFAVYNSNLSKWLNQGALAWNNIGAFTFNGKTPTFYPDSKTYPLSAVTAGISNLASLVGSGNVIVNEATLDSYQKTVRGTRGALGTDSAYIYLAVITGATVPDAAYVMQALGATDVLNLDGGGSSALYINGAYKVGPGRALPNAIVLVR